MIAMPYVPTGMEQWSMDPASQGIPLVYDPNTGTFYAYPAIAISGQGWPYIASYAPGGPPPVMPPTPQGMGAGPPSMLPNFQVVDQAVPPDLRSWPKRRLFVLSVRLSESSCVRP